MKELEKIVQELILWFTPAKCIGVIFAIITYSYLFYITKKRRVEIWSAFVGDDGKLNTIEVIMLIWSVLFTNMIIADFAVGLHASEEAWYSMDAVFLFCVGGKGYETRARGINPPKS